MNIKFTIKIALIIIVSVNTMAFSMDSIFIRTNQVGFLPSDIKTGVILTSEDLSMEEFSIINIKTDEITYSGKINNSNGEFGRFNYSYTINFSSLVEPGTYQIIIKSTRSHKFNIGLKIYNPVVNELMKFFKVQRCGYTNPYKHDTCHIADATELIIDGVVFNTPFDVTGGWHDAGDYTKFFNTIAYATYTLLFAYEFDGKRFGFDQDGNDVPDILEEAKIGLDWLLRAQYDDKKFITQVQNLRDHDVGWRMPEDDTLRFDRPAYIGIGKNLIGIYVATMSLAYRIWKDKFESYDFADKCLTAAENYYSIINFVPDVDSSGTGQYIDKSYLGKLALGAIELYHSSKRELYLQQAKSFAQEASSEYWWSNGDIAAYAHYKLAKIDKNFTSYIENNLIRFEEKMKQNLFGEPVSLSWGSNNTILGVTLQNILWKNLTGRTDYDSLAMICRDYILGRNQWGVSFISKKGSLYSKNLHHQVSYLRKIILPGGFAAGPVKKDLLDSYDISFSSTDKFEMFQTDSAVYRDDRMDYITNEPTISANATAVFVMGYFSNR